MASTAKMAADGNHTNGNYSSNDEKPIEFHQNGGDSTRDMATEALERIRTTGSITMTPEQFERLYLQPQGQVKGGRLCGGLNAIVLPAPGMAWFYTIGRGYFHKFGTAADHTQRFPVLSEGHVCGLEGFLSSSLATPFPLSCSSSMVRSQMATLIVLRAAYEHATGGILFGWAATLQPYFDTAGAFAPPTGNYQTQNQEYRAGLMEGPFWSSLAFQPLAAGMLSLIFLVGALRVNIVFVLVFFTVSIGFLTLSASFWKMGLGEMVLYERLLEATGGFWFVTSLLGWYLLFVQVMDAVGFAWPLPVGDLSGYWAKREKTKKPAGDQV
ncbi:Protein alcS [Pseudocercospora fuligena]|uniref:Protein alcS n=1 Tax=Pseudocercospora fuligena TaxID=685502 RepID=A0A8H6R6U2_9PEZI|nr:Protein alcS [Pseudocercospora fuligena]